MSVLAFVGPSLHGAHFEPDGVALKPPAQAGDIYRAARDGARAIALIDGVFEQRPAVRHKEILWALSQGVHVFGAASMGALRAAECERYGMVGSGAVFLAYRSGELIDDDEVALLHAPAELGFAPLTVPMVNVRASLEASVADAACNVDELAIAVAVAKSIHYKLRTWDAIVDALSRSQGWDGAELRAWLTRNQTDQKQADAVALLEYLQAHVAELCAEPHLCNFRFRDGSHWQHMRDTFDLDADPTPAVTKGDALVLDELRLTPCRFIALALVAWGQCRDSSAQRIAVNASGHAVELHMEAFRLAHDLTTRDTLEAWCSDNLMKPDELKRSLNGLAALQDEISESVSRLIPTLLAPLKLSGEYARLLQRGEAKAQVSAQALPDAAKAAESVDEMSATGLDLLGWYAGELRALGWRVSSLDEVARALGMPAGSAVVQLWVDEHRYEKWLT